MLLELVRKKSDADSTIGELSINGQFQCYTLEDEYRKVKVMHETRIPAGTYEIKLQTNGDMTKKYYAKFPGIHKGMLWLQNIPNFTSVYIHIGNTDDDTSGCILVGKQFTKDMKLIQSTDAYIPLYVKVIQALDNKEKVEIRIIDADLKES